MPRYYIQPFLTIETVQATATAEVEALAPNVSVSCTIFVPAATADVSGTVPNFHGDCTISLTTATADSAGVIVTITTRDGIRSTVITKGRKVTISLSGSKSLPSLKGRKSTVTLDGTLTESR